MPVQPKLSRHEWFDSEEHEFIDAFDEFCPFYPPEELELLRKYMLKGKSPGAVMLLRRMEALDNSLSSLFDDLDRFNPQEHHKIYQADNISRRYIYIKTTIQTNLLNNIQKTIEERIKRFNLDVENTRLYREPNGIAEARAWRKNFHQEQAKEARRERAAQKRCTYRSAAHDTAAPSHPKPVLKVKTGTGS